MATTEDQLAEIEGQIRQIAERNPAAVVFAMLDVFVTVACGDNPALRDYKRLQLMRGIRSKLGAMARRNAGPDNDKETKAGGS